MSSRGPAAQLHTEPSLLPPMHDPDRRVEVAVIPGWEVRVLPFNHPGSASLARRGMHHLQLWSPLWQISAVSPSALTDGRWEVVRGDQRLRVHCVHHLGRVCEQWGVLPPDPLMVREQVMFWVTAHLIGVVPASSGLTLSGEP